MNERIKITVCAVTVCIAVIMSAVTVNSFLEKDNTNPDSITVQPTEGYVIMAYYGKIAVFNPNHLNTPLAVTDININTLRDSDRRMLADGIRLNDEAEVAQLLEDLGS